ncbi:MAG: hypothetical protein U0U67_15060 [Chitinophagales bacterium]
MSVYDLNNIAYLELDIQRTFSVINSLYKIDYTINPTFYFPKTFVNKDIHWASETSQDELNKLVPIAKSLVKDMYAILENIYKGKTGKFEKLELEKKYKYLKEFRLLNNKFKHFIDKEAEIDIVGIVFIEEDKNYIDMYCSFKYPNKDELLRFCDFIEIYYNILEDNKIITMYR